VCKTRAIAREDNMKSPVIVSFLLSSCLVDLNMMLFKICLDEW
jgi:hypothetical protein